jgi:outer membrane protein assembly factor BamE (lipoprotein component of BamABCDE complex)
MNHFANILTTGLFITVAAGCTPASQHRQEVRDDTGERITVGTVQQKIKKGMSSAEVIEALGSPNIISTDSESREVWVYDKVSSEVISSSSSGGVGGGLGALGGTIGGIGLGSYKESSGATASSQRTLTVVIKFDGDGNVRDYSYRTSRF